MNNSSKIKLVILVAIFGCNMFWSSGRGTIEGTVKNAGGDTVADADIITSPKGYTATTGSDGKYIITDIDIGEYTVNAFYGSLTGSTATVVEAGSFFSCAGKTATCNITISSTSSAGWETLTSPLNGTYSGGGYFLTEANSPYEVTEDVFFYQTNVEIKDNVTIKFVRETIDDDTSFIFGENTNIIINNGITFCKEESLYVECGIFIESGSKVTLDTITIEENIGAIIRREVDIRNSIIEYVSIDVESTGTNSIEYSNIDYIALEGNAIGDITYCNTKDISLGDNSSAIVSNCNFTGTGTVLSNDSSNAVDATDNWWGTTSTTTIAGMIYDFYDNSDFGIVTFEPILDSTVTTAGPQ